MIHETKEFCNDVVSTIIEDDQNKTAPSHREKRLERTYRKIPRDQAIVNDPARVVECIRENYRYFCRDVMADTGASDRAHSMLIACRPGRQYIMKSSFSQALRPFGLGAVVFVATRSHSG